VSARETHVTEFGLGLCAGVVPTAGWYGNIMAREALRARGLRADTRACDGAEVELPGHDAMLTANTPFRVPTCPRCAVLRDEALEGRLPARKSPASE